MGDKGKYQKGSVQLFNKFPLYLQKLMCIYNTGILLQWQHAAFTQFLVKLSYYDVKEQMDLVHASGDKQT